MPVLGSVNLYNAAKWPLADHEGSVRDIVDDAGDLVEHPDHTVDGETSRFDRGVPGGGVPGTPYTTIDDPAPF